MVDTIEMSRWEFIPKAGKVVLRGQVPNWVRHSGNVFHLHGFKTVETSAIIGAEVIHGSVAMQTEGGSVYVLKGACRPDLINEADHE